MALRHVTPSLRKNLTPTDIATDALITVVHRWGRMQPFDLAAQALDGEFNVATKAIGNAVSRMRSRPELQITFAPLDEITDPPDETRDVVDRVITRDLVQKIASSSPDARATLQALIDNDVNYTLAARQLGITPRALRKRLRKLEAQHEEQAP